MGPAGDRCTAPRPWHRTDDADVDGEGRAQPHPSCRPVGERFLVLDGVGRVNLTSHA